MAGMNEFNPKSDPSIYGLPEKQRKQAELTVTRGGPATSTATGNGGRNPTGPQQQLAKNPFDVGNLRFPTDVAINPANRHWIKFVPLIQEQGKYKVSTSSVGAADAANAPRLGPSVGAVTGGLTALNAVETVLSGSLGAVGDVIDAANPTASVKDRISSAQDAAGKVASFGAQLGLAATIVSGINLSRKTKRAASYICLYMPDTVNFTTVNDYDTVSLTGALGKAGLAAQAGSDLANLVANKQGASLGSSAGLREAAGMLGEQSGLFGAGITDVLLFSAGLAQNPQMEVLFKATRNREFQFDFKFTPKSQSETTTIQKIIQAFRFYAAPEISNQGARYFVPPSEFDIQFMYGANPHPYLPKISSCALEGIDVNFASAGQWATFKGGAPVEISMQLRFKEVEILNKERIMAGF